MLADRSQLNIGPDHISTFYVVTGNVDDGHFKPGTQHIGKSQAAQVLSQEASTRLDFGGLTCREIMEQENSI